MDPRSIQKTVEDFAGFLLEYFIALAAVGALAMALIELWKKLRDSRTRFHMSAVTNWLKAPLGTTQDEWLRLLVTPEPKITRESAFTELIHLTTGSPQRQSEEQAKSLLFCGGGPKSLLGFERKPEHALFALELDRMLGHIQNASDIALSNPRRYPSLYTFMTYGADPSDVRDWYQEADQLPDVPSAEPIDRAAAKRRAGIYERLQQVVKRKLDGFQLYQNEKWANWNQLAANAVGTLVLFAALLVTREAKTVLDVELLGIVVMSLLGGMLAPIAKDIVTALRKVRGG